MSVRILLLLTVLLAPSGCAKTPPPIDAVPVRVGLVAVDTRNLPVVVLEEKEGPRWLPIWIGTAEARSIAIEMEKQPMPRPNTHDLAKRVIQGLQGEVLRVVVTELRSGTYFATLALRVRGEIVEIDSRPSDAIAIALRANAPIFVNPALFENAAPHDLELEEDDDGQQI